MNLLKKADEKNLHEYSGDSFSFDGINAPINNFELYGNTEQNDIPTPESPQEIKTVTGYNEINVDGKNLLDISDITTSEKIINNGDGSITLNGTISGGTSYSLTNPFILKANTTYILSLTNFSSDYSGSTFILRNGTTNILQVNFGVGTVNYTPTQNVTIDTLRIFINNHTFNNFTFSIQLEKGSTATEYEAYKGHTYEINLGKNLFDKDSGFRKGYIDSYGTFYPESATAVFNQYISCQPNTIYTVSFNANVRALGAPIYYNKNKTLISRENAVNNVNKRTITTPNNCFYMVIQFSIDSAEITQEKIDAIDCQLERGSQVTSYAPFMKNNLFDNDNANIINGSFSANDPISINNNVRSLYIPCEYNKTYKITKNNITNRFRAGTTSVIPGASVSVQNVVGNDSGKSITITTGSNSEYLIIYYWTNGDSLTEEQIRKSIVIYDTSTAQYPIELPNGNYIYKNNDKWHVHKVWEKIENYNGETITTDYISTTGELTIGATVWYKLATEIDVEITNEILLEQLETIPNSNTYNGVNNVSLYSPTIIGAIKLWVYSWFNFSKILKDGYIIKEDRDRITQKFANGHRKQILSDYEDCMITINFGSFDLETTAEYLEQLESGTYQYYSIKDKKYKEAKFVVEEKPTLTTMGAVESPLLEEYEVNLLKAGD